MTKPYRNPKKPVTPLARQLVQGHRVLLDTTGHLWIDRTGLRRLCKVQFLPRRLKRASHIANNDIPLVSLQQLFSCSHATMRPAISLLLSAVPHLYRKAFPEMHREALLKHTVFISDLARTVKVDPHVLCGTFDQLYALERMYAISDQGFFTKVESIRHLSPTGQIAVLSMIGCRPQHTSTEQPA